MIHIKTQDGLILKGSLSLPEGDGAISKLAIAIGGAEPLLITMLLLKSLVPFVLTKG